ncbi:type II toxin-antitoxin system RelE/ParE family toxin [Cysteiniphilum sp. JM-1]|uniref:type II toxin-antitoxin system RelE/ParE family toxin n=1 Tax=Cysteiniphilum sp. JM-1 TaxID=2610891 RepID=UPI001243D09C|nr:type II toxin-antitoxin system RelE/ParE family toxin [Cysteiniphilum sp. JM-1]
MVKIQWHELARADLFAILNYISNDNPDAAQQLKDEVDFKISHLIKFPKIGRPGRVKRTRELIVWANYIVVYQENQHMIKILRLLHAAQQWPKT